MLVYLIYLRQFPLVSGITYDIDTSFNSTVEFDTSGFFSKLMGKEEFLDLNKKYKTAFGLFMANGGDRYTMLLKYDVIKEALLPESYILSVYIKEHLNSVIPEK